MAYYNTIPKYPPGSIGSWHGKNSIGVDHIKGFGVGFIFRDKLKGELTFDYSAGIGVTNDYALTWDFAANPSPNRIDILDRKADWRLIK